MIDPADLIERWLDRTNCGPKRMKSFRLDGRWQLRAQFHIKGVGWRTVAAASSPGLGSCLWLLAFNLGITPQPEAPPSADGLIEQIDEEVFAADGPPAARTFSCRFFRLSGIERDLVHRALIYLGKSASHGVDSQSRHGAFELSIRFQDDEDGAPAPVPCGSNYHFTERQVTVLTQALEIARCPAAGFSSTNHRIEAAELQEHFPSVEVPWRNK